MKTRFLSTGIFSLIEKLIKVVLSFITISLIAKNYDLDIFGDYAYHMAFFTILSLIVNFGTEQLIVYNTSPSEGQIKLFNYFILRLMAAVFSCFFIFILEYYSFLDSSYSIFFCISLLMQSLFVITPYYQGLLSYKKISFFISISLILSFAIKVYLIVVLKDFSLPLIIVLDSVLTFFALLLVYTVDSDLKFRLDDFCMDDFNKIFRLSFPFFISALGIVIYSRLDQVMIKNILGDSSVGLYSSIIKLSEIFTFILPVVVNLCLSVVSCNSANSNSYLRMLKVMNVYSILSIVFLFFFKDKILTALYTDDFLAVSNVLVVYSFSLIFIVMGSMSNVWLIQNGMQKYKVKRVVLGLLINMILNYLLIPIYGLMGAAVATVISQFFSSFFSNFLDKKTRKLFYLQLKSLKVYKW